MKRVMILFLTIFFVYGVVESWQINFDSSFATNNEKKLITVFENAFSSVSEKAKYPGGDDELLYETLNGMLQNLDPHSNYLSPDQFKELKEDQEGKFFGIGVLISKPSVDSPILVINPIEGTPAFKAGLRSGDLITEIEGQSTSQMESKQAVKKLKGPKGTKVTITVLRDDDEPFKVTLERDEIPKNSVSYSFILTEGIGFIKVSQFGETTVEEVQNSLKNLKTKGAQSFILDLRGNPGGLLNASIGLCSLFLKEDLPIVSVRPRKGWERKFRSDGCKEFCNCDIVVLIDRGSASASEIVAGALKDNKRATIIGTQSWGKGLVQSVSPLIKGAALITTAHYFTPSGVNIQRSYASREHYFFPDLEENSKEKSEGGIIPDIVVEQSEIPSLALKIEIRRLFLEFVSKNSNHNFFEGQNQDDNLLLSFKEFLKTKEIQFSEDEWKESASYNILALKRDYSTLKNSPEEGFKVMLQIDPQTKKAVEILTAKEKQEKAA